MRRLLLAQRLVEDGVGVGSVEAHGCHLVQGPWFMVHGSGFMVHGSSSRELRTGFTVSGVGFPRRLLALPHSG